MDRIGSEHHELSGRAKDLGSAAVFIALALNALVWAPWWAATCWAGGRLREQAFF